MLDLREEREGDEESDDDDAPVKKKRRDEGLGFGGTLLGRSSQPGSRSSVEATDMEVDYDEPGQCASSTSKQCFACTFANVHDASTCEMCDTPFN